MNSRTLVCRLVGGISLLLVVALGLSLLPGMGPIPVAHAATFTVNSTGDEPDVNPGDGICDTDDTDFEITCTLRAAIEEANASPDADGIDFDVPGSTLVTIQPGSALPTITDPVTIDGTTEQLRRVRLDGLDAGAGADGLRITAGNSTVKGLEIIRFSGHGLALTMNGVNTIQGNYIGVTFSNMVNMGNGGDGILISDIANNTIGGTVVGMRNVISGNKNHGIEISGTFASGSQILGNYIGVNVTGTIALSNTLDGVYIDSAPNNTIGGTTTAVRNVISGNGQYGVHIYGGGATGNQVLGNYIGTNVNGTAALGNWRGVSINSGGNTIGGDGTGMRNVISGNKEDGVGVGMDGRGNQVLGNLVGTDASGTAILGNGGNGVSIESYGNTIGGTATGARNVISGNDKDGISFGMYTSGNQVLGNLIGTDISGTAALGNSGNGVSFSYMSSGNDIGGTASGARNVISGNKGDGVWIGWYASGNEVLGNLIGTDINGLATLGNSGSGVFIMSELYSNTVGGTEAGAGNTIAANNGDGIVVASGIGNAIRHNAIFSNTRLGIDLSPSGVTPNDLGDLDTGANNLQNFPILTLATSGGSTKIQGTLNSTPNTTFTLEFFSNSACDPSGHGEGKTFIGSTTAATDSNGNVSFTASFDVPASGFVTATAIDPNNNTSEFSQCIKVTPLYLVYLPLVVK